MEHDLQLRAIARAIYDACYPSDDWAPFSFDEAEKYKTVHYRQAVWRRSAGPDRACQPIDQPRLFAVR